MKNISPVRTLCHHYPIKHIYTLPQTRRGLTLLAQLCRDPALQLPHPQFADIHYNAPHLGSLHRPLSPALQRLLSPVPVLSTRTRPAPLPGQSSVAPTGRRRWRCPRPPGPQQGRGARHTDTVTLKPSRRGASEKGAQCARAARPLPRPGLGDSRIVVCGRALTPPQPWG